MTYFDFAKFVRGTRFTVSETLSPEGLGALLELDRRTRALAPTSTVVASLPSAVTAGAGSRHFVTDATATTFLDVVAGGGANAVPVVSDGVDWRIG